MSPIKKNILLNIVRVGFNLLFPLITFPIVSRALGPEYLGKVDFASTVISYFVLISSVGIPTYGVVVCAKSKNNLEKLRKVVCELLYINLVFVLLAYAMFFACFLLVPKFKTYKMLLLINSSSILFTAMGVEWLYNALEQFKYITIRSIIFKIISLIMIVLFVKKSEDYYLYAIILVLASVGSNFYNFIHAKKYIHFYPVKALDIKRHLIPIAAFFAAALAGTINSNTDTIMLGFFSGDYAVGLYTFSVKIKSLLTAVMTAAFSVFIPRFSLYVAEKKYTQYRMELRKILLITISFAIAIACICIVFVDEIIMVLGGKSYIEAKITVIILTTSIIILAITWTLGVGILQVIGREKKYTKTIFIACLINVVLNIMLIPILQTAGAAIATLVTEIINAILFYRYSKDFIDGCLKKISMGKLLIVGSIDMLICYQLKQIWCCMNPFIILLLGGGIFLLIYLLSIVIVHKEIRSMLQNLKINFKNK